MPFLCKILRDEDLDEVRAVELNEVRLYAILWIDDRAPMLVIPQTFASLRPLFGG